jgi:non-specific serine/threonine protein kinase
MSLGDHDEALVLIEEALRVCEPIGEAWTASLAWFALSVVAVSSGDPARARDAAQQSIRLRQPLGDVRNVGLNFEELAWSAAASGDGERAARLFGAAHEVERSIGYSMNAIAYVAELHERYERVAREAVGDAAFERWWAAGEQLDFDEACAYALGAEKSADASSTDAAADAGLTKREWEVAHLLAQGMSNRAIAAQLFISQRTAETHVEHILVKLSFTSRAQVAAWISQQRPSAD